MICRYLVLGLVGSFLAVGIAFYFYYDYAEGEMITLRDNNTKLQSAITSFETERAQFHASISKMTEINQELAQERNKLSTKVNELANKFGKHDIGMLGNRKPGLVERTINKSVRGVNNEIKIITSITSE